MVMGMVKIVILVRLGAGSKFKFLESKLKTTTKLTISILDA